MIRVIHVSEQEYMKVVKCETTAILIPYGPYEFKGDSLGFTQFKTVGIRTHHVKSIKKISILEFGQFYEARLNGKSLISHERVQIRKKLGIEKEICLANHFKSLQWKKFFYIEI